MGTDARRSSHGERESVPAIQGKPSIVTVRDGRTIRDAATGSCSATGLDMDVFPGLAANTSVANALAGAGAARLVDLNADREEDLDCGEVAILSGFVELGSCKGCDHFEVAI